MPSPPSQRHDYIPAGIDRAMSQQLQQSLPANLKQYANPDHPTYVPQHVQRQIEQHMQKNMPAHLKNYAGAYMEQRIVQPGLAHPAGASPRAVRPRPPVPDRLRQDHSNVSASQYEARLGTDMFSPDAATPEQPAAAVVGGPTEAPPTPQANYDFIMNPQAPPQSSGRLPGSNAAWPVRAAIFGGGLLALLVVLLIFKSLLTSSPGLTPFVGIAQDQQELIHLASRASLQQDLSATNRNFAATTQLTVGSSQSDIVTYLKENKTKLKAKQLSLKVSTSVDNQLAAAEAAGTYNQTFQEVMRTQLNSYSTNLQRAYKDAGQKGRVLLSSDFAQVKLLLQQLGSLGS